MKRFFPFLAAFICVILCFFCIAPSGSAAGIDYNDYVSNVVVDGDNDIVTVSLPLDKFFWRLSWGDSYVDYDGSSFSHTYYSENDYYLGLFSPFIDATQIPDGTQIYLTFDISELRGMGGYRTPQPFGNLYYSNGEAASVALSKDETQGGIFEFTHILEYNNSDSFRVSVGLNSFNPLPEFTGSTATCTLRSCIMEFSISSLLRLQQTTGKTNKILQAVEDAINNPASAVTPEGDNIISDFQNQEQEILNDADDAWGESQKIFGDFNLSLSTLAVTFGGMSAFLNKLFALPAFQILLSISLAIGVLASVLNMASSGKTEGDKDAKNKGGN